VSSSQSKDNLKSQVKRLADYCAAKGYPITHEVSEIGSGLNDSRRKLLRLFDQDDWSVLVVEHKDRLTRFGFRYLERLAAAQDRKIEVINATDDDTDLMGDLVSVITSFCARIYGHRRSKRRTEKIIAEMSAHD
jgi:predicted site-specific integrase-resolvase